MQMQVINNASKFVVGDPAHVRIYADVSLCDRARAHIPACLRIHVLAHACEHVRVHICLNKRACIVYPFLYVHVYAYHACAYMLVHVRVSFRVSFRVPSRVRDCACTRWTRFRVCRARVIISHALRFDQFLTRAA